MEGAYELVQAPAGAKFCKARWVHDDDIAEELIMINKTDTSRPSCSELGESPCPRTHFAVLPDVSRSSRSGATEFTNSCVVRRFGSERMIWRDVGVGYIRPDCSNDAWRRSRAREECMTTESNFILSTRCLERRVERGAAVIWTVVSYIFYLMDRCTRNNLGLKFRYWKIAQVQAHSSLPRTTTLPTRQTLCTFIPIDIIRNHLAQAICVLHIATFSPRKNINHLTW